MMSSLQKGITLLLAHLSSTTRNKCIAREKNSGARSGGNRENPQRALMRKKVATNAGRG